MSGYKAFMEQEEELEQKKWEAVANAKGFFCVTCRVMLSKDEVDAFGNTCSRHQNGLEDSK
jgi:hypothetical protein